MAPQIIHKVGTSILASHVLKTGNMIASILIDLRVEAADAVPANEVEMKVCIFVHHCNYCEFISSFGLYVLFVVDDTHLRNVSDLPSQKHPKRSEDHPRHRSDH
jgi:hypothetical protein